MCVHVRTQCLLLRNHGLHILCKTRPNRRFLLLFSYCKALWWNNGHGKAKAYPGISFLALCLLKHRVPNRCYYKRGLAFGFYGNFHSMTIAVSIDFYRCDIRGIFRERLKNAVFMAVTKDQQNGFTKLSGRFLQCGSKL